MWRWMSTECPTAYLSVRVLEPQATEKGLNGIADQRLTVDFASLLDPIHRLIHAPIDPFQFSVRKNKEFIVNPIK